LGPNGAGKTTFVKIMLGIIRRTSGQATMLGLPAGHQESRRKVGYMPENLRVPRYHTARSALEFYGSLSGMPPHDVRLRRDGLLELVGLADRARESIAKYSKGMLQRLGLAQALLHDPDLLFLDEPTDGLDPVGRSDVRQIINSLKEKGKTVFLNSHLLQEVEMVCDRVAILHKGVLRSLGRPQEIAPDRIEGIDLELELKGPPEAAREAVGNRQMLRSEAVAEGHYRLVVRLDEDRQVDELVDDLRSRRVSIVHLARRRVTLEDAFLRIIEKASQVA
jgi:ABC-2 type transport system ATP-binding protein